MGGGIDKYLKQDIIINTQTTESIDKEVLFSKRTSKTSIVGYLYNKYVEVK